MIILGNSSINHKLYWFTGGGGVGKSYVIQVISRYVDKIFTKVGDNPMRPKVLLLAPTGKAAAVIGKNKNKCLHEILYVISL